MIPPAICLLSSVWIMSARQAHTSPSRRRERQRGCNGQRRRSRTTSRTAFVTAGIAALRGGVPIRVNGKVVGAVRVAGLSKETDTGIANTAAAALSSGPKTDQGR
ncbi:heme-binding protein [Bradyrhizobium sp. 186]|nr:heme-binding protein [Bradyrhizobium sp. 186]